MRFIIFPVLLFFLPVLASAQQRQYATANKQAIKYFALANQSLDEDLYDEAIAQLQKATEADDKFVEAHFVLADVYRLTKQHQLAILQYLKVIRLNPDYNRSVYLKIGDEEFNISRYDDAQQYLEKYLSNTDITPQNKRYAQKRIADCKFSINALQHPVPFKP
ncbi:MAG TPA: tetratricopeptide repeat protein, partial [Mucilaginibacter sp.]